MGPVLPWPWPAWFTWPDASPFIPLVASVGISLLRVSFPLGTNIASCGFRPSIRLSADGHLGASTLRGVDDGAVSMGVRAPDRALLSLLWVSLGCGSAGAYVCSETVFLGRRGSAWVWASPEMSRGLAPCPPSPKSISVLEPLAQGQLQRVPDPRHPEVRCGFP